MKMDEMDYLPIDNKPETEEFTFVDLCRMTDRSIMETKRRKSEIPIWERSCLTLEEAAMYSGIGIHKIRELTNDPQCDFVLRNGVKRLIKRRKLDEFIERTSVI